MDNNIGIRDPYMSQLCVSDVLLNLYNKNGKSVHYIKYLRQ